MESLPSPGTFSLLFCKGPGCMYSFWVLWNSLFNPNEQRYLNPWIWGCYKDGINVRHYPISPFQVNKRKTPHIMSRFPLREFLPWIREKLETAYWMATNFSSMMDKEPGDRPVMTMSHIFSGNSFSSSDPVHSSRSHPTRTLWPRLLYCMWKRTFCSSFTPQMNSIAFSNSGCICLI